MLNLSTCTENDILAFGKSLWSSMKNTSANFEQAAQLCVEEIYRTFVDENGHPAFGLVRLYRLGSYDDLMPELQQLAAPEPKRWLALLGTVGEEKDWCDRRLSKGHRAIPIGANLTPMLKAAFEQLSMQGTGEESASQLQLQEGMSFTRYFYVENAPGSPHIPAQDEFVKPYGIRSVIGLGTTFSTRNSCILLGFSKVPISPDKAEAIAALTPYVTTPLAMHEEHRALWQQAG